MQPRTAAHMENLENRKLLSAWTTVSSDPTQNEVSVMAADDIGNVYALDTWNSSIKKSSDGGATWALIAKAPASTRFNSIAIDGDGDLLIAGAGVGADGGNWHWLVFENRACQSGLSVIDDVPSGDCVGLSTDAAGDVYAIGSVTKSVTTTVRNKPVTTTTSYATVRELASGQSAFATVQQASGMTFRAVTAIDGGASAGVYVVGASGSAWSVLKSADAGTTWSIIDQYRYPTASGATAANEAYAVVGDLSGNVFVAGGGLKATLTGSAKGKPVYSYRNHWLVRKSGDGGVTWTVDDDYLLSSSGSSYMQGMGTDLAGNVYVVGGAEGASGDHAIIRTNTGGAWATVDDYTTSDNYAFYFSFTADSNGRLYVGGQDWDGQVAWLVRSAAGPTGAPATFSSLEISSDATDDDDDALLELINQN